MEIMLVQTIVTGILNLFPNEISDGVRNFVASLVEQIPTLTKAEADVETFVRAELERVRTMIAENRDPTEEEWAALHSTVQSELDRLNAQGTPDAAGA